ncbi:MAG: hypothetical protein ACYSUR_04995, partial [Planctomycetota bacterium]
RLLHSVAHRVIVLLSDDNDVGRRDGFHQYGVRHAVAVLALVNRQRRAHVGRDLRFSVTTWSGAPAQDQAQDADRGGRGPVPRGCGGR